MGLNTFSRRSFWKWRFPRSVKGGLKTIEHVPPSTFPLFIGLHDDQPGLRDRLKPEDCETTSTTSHFAFLPFELCQAIIDNLSDDPAALCACSLTCKTFLDASRRHIFHSIRLDSQEEATRFLDKICFTDSPTSPCTYVRILSMYEEDEEITSFPNPRFLNKTLPFLATCLPNVTSLTLYGLKWMALDDGTRVKISSGFQKVQSLTLHGFFETSQQVNAFISSFPLLTTLCSRMVSWGAYREPVIPLPRGLKSIAVKPNQSHFFNRLLHLKPHPDISTLYLGDLHPKDAQEVGELLKTLGSRLEHLRLTEHCGTLATAVCANHINLAHNTNLHSVRLVLWSTVLDNPSTLDWVCTLFSQITSHHMDDVWLLLPVYHAVNLDVFFSSIECIFTQQHWSSLRRFEITAFKDPMKEAPKPIEVYMPILNSRGVVLKLE